MFDNDFVIGIDLTKYLKDSAVGSVLIKISPSNIFLIMLFPFKFLQDYQAAFGIFEH